MSPKKDWISQVGRYLAWAGALVLAAVLVGWPWLDAEGRRALAFAAGIVLPVQTLNFAVLALGAPGSAGFLGIWAVGTLVRIGGIGVAGFAVVGMNGVDPVVGLLSMAGLFFATSLLELWTLRSRMVP